MGAACTCDDYGDTGLSCLMNAYGVSSVELVVSTKLISGEIASTLEREFSLSDRKCFENTVAKIPLPLIYAMMCPRTGIYHRVSDHGSSSPPP